MAKTIREFPNYSIDEYGVVINLTSGKIIKYQLDKKGYMMVHLKNIKTKNRYVHRLVAQMYVSGEGDDLVVNHIDCNILNNHYSNLEWVTRKRNSEHAVENNLYPKGQTHHLAKITDSQVMEMRELNANGLSQKKIADRFNIDPSVVSRYITRKRGGAYR